MRSWLPFALVAAATACATLPDTQPLPAGQEAAHAVSEIQPGHWHVMVRVNYFAPEAEAERLLRARAAALCPGEDAVLEHLRLVSQPHQASAEVHCRAMQDPRLDDTSRDVGMPAERTNVTTPGPVHPQVAAAPERSMEQSGPGVAAQRPQPGYLPAFASVAADRRDGEERSFADAEKIVTDGWIPATGDATGAAAVTVAVEELAVPPRQDEPAKRFWPTVRDTYDGLLAELE
jgi:hypothetical protein